MPVFGHGGPPHCTDRKSLPRPAAVRVPGVNPCRQKHLTPPGQAPERHGRSPRVPEVPHAASDDSQQGGHLHDIKKDVVFHSSFPFGFGFGLPIALLRPASGIVSRNTASEKGLGKRKTLRNRSEGGERLVFLRRAEDTQGQDKFPFFRRRPIFPNVSYRRAAQVPFSRPP